jgi:hypothetical protein
MEISAKHRQQAALAAAVRSNEADSPAVVYAQGGVEYQ